MSGPTVFISYSHQDEDWKDRLVRQLRILELEGDLEVWEDRRIAAGATWRDEIEVAMEQAGAAVLLISADFLISDFIRGTEVPHLLQRRAQDGLRIIPLIVRPCPWRAVEWLAAIECRPKDGRALSKGRKAKVEEDLTALTLEIRDLLRRDRPQSPPRPPERARAIERAEGPPVPRPRRWLILVCLAVVLGLLYAALTLQAQRRARRAFRVGDLTVQMAECPSTSAQNEFRDSIERLGVPPPTAAGLTEDLARIADDTDAGRRIASSATLIDRLADSLQGHDGRLVRLGYSNAGLLGTIHSWEDLAGQDLNKVAASLYLLELSQALSEGDLSGKTFDGVRSIRPGQFADLRGRSAAAAALVHLRQSFEPNVGVTAEPCGERK